ncbi:uncharacterized protein PG986_001892 [Apiospora aurea]|uniref:Uncharacterized protein n=1 Tax=Apiospora aurea TaxID=335848 RepID=A0ABR1QY48_9PEZI
MCTEKIEKVRLQYTTDENLLANFKEHGGGCSVTWITPQKGEEIVPPQDTVAVVVNVSQDKGAVRIFEKSGSDKRIAAVGTEDAGYTVIIPWDGKWWFRVSGSPGVGYIQRAEDKVLTLQ